MMPTVTSARPLTQATVELLRTSDQVNSKTPDQNSEEHARAGGAESSLGARLRQAREARGVSLRELSDQTRIARRYLEAIEQDDYKELPGGIFTRSFIKAYA
jgi:ribosome-binding protein aMBF1 (putative translation factor)